MSGDDSQENARRAIGPRSALFPVLQCRGLETEPRGKLRLAQTEASPQRTHISRRNPNGSQPHGDIFTTGPGDRLLQTGYDLLTHAALGGCPLWCSPVFHFFLPLSRPAAFRRKNGVSTTVIGARSIVSYYTLKAHASGKDLELRPFIPVRWTRVSALSAPGDCPRVSSSTVDNLVAEILAPTNGITDPPESLPKADPPCNPSARRPCPCSLLGPLGRFATSEAVRRAPPRTSPSPPGVYERVRRQVESRPEARERSG